MVHSVNSVSSWFHCLRDIGCCYLTELDYKDQFNHAPPQKVVAHLEQSTSWLVKHRRWRMEEVTWSVHKDTKRLDRAGRGNSTKFWYFEHQDLSAKIEFELKHNNYVQAAGNVWKRPGCISMGGSFSARSADLHCQWEVYQHRHLFRDLGTLQITASGFVY